MPQPGREPVPVGAWNELEASVARWVSSATARWTDPTFRLDTMSRSPAREALNVSTTVEPGGTVTPVAGNPVRGASGVRVQVESPIAYREKPSTFDALLEARLGFVDPRPLSLTEAELEAARAEVGGVIKKWPELRKALMRVTWGPLGAEGSDRREGGEFSDAGSVLISTARVVSSVLEESGVTVGEPCGVEAQHVCANRAVGLLRRSVEPSVYRYELVALLNCPVVDAIEGVKVWEGRFEEPCYLEFGYPSDDLCARVLRSSGHASIPHGSRLDQINCYARWAHAMSADQDSDGEAGRNSAAEAYLRDAVDLLRVTSEGDIGILHVSGWSVPPDKGLLSPPFRWFFQEAPWNVAREVDIQWFKADGRRQRERRRVAVTARSAAVR